MLKKILKFLIIAIPVTGLSFFISNDTYLFLIQEDSIYENLTALTMLAGSILLVIKLFKGNVKGAKRIYYILLALMMFFGFGEEISWGQRIFDLQTNEYFSNHNLQGETNLHNLKINGVKLNKAIFSIGLGIVIGLYFFVLPFAYKGVSFVKSIIDKFGIHVPKIIAHSGVFVLGSIIVLCIPHGKKWELIEVIFVLSFFLVLIDPFNEKEGLLKR